MTNFPIQCLSCGATGEVLRVTANLQCRCGSKDLDLWDGEKTAGVAEGKDYAEQAAQYMRDQGRGPTHSAWFNQGWAHGHAGQPARRHNAEYMLGHNEGTVRAREDRYMDEAARKESAAHGPGTGWGRNQPDASANWDQYAGPTPGENPRIKEQLDSDDTHECPICHGTGKASFGGGGYAEGVCRNCHGTGKVVYPTENDAPSLDAHLPKGTDLGAGSNGHYSSKAGFSDHHVTRYVNWARSKGHDPDEVDTLKKYEKEPNVGRAHTNFIADQLYIGGGDQDWRKNAKANKVAVPGLKTNKVVTAKQGDKIMAMAATIVENNSGLSTQEAFELARRAIVSFPEDQD